MVQMNLFAGQEQRHRSRERVCRHREGSGGWDELGDEDTDTTSCKIHSENRLHSPGFPGGASGKEPTRQCRRLEMQWRRSPGEGHDDPLQDSCLENPMGVMKLIWLKFLLKFYYIRYILILFHRIP